MKRLILPLFLSLAAYLPAAPIDDATFSAIMQIADREGVPLSVAARLMFEESGDPVTLSRGDPDAIGDEATGWPSVGLYQLHTKPENIDYLVKTHWTDRGETGEFDIRNPRHNSTVALRYLADLHRRFGTWYLAACYYNCGPPRWDHIAKRYLPKIIPPGTQRYARRIIYAPDPVLPREPSFDHLPEAFRAAAVAEWRMGR
jgi:hypothetical protein